MHCSSRRAILGLAATLWLLAAGTAEAVDASGADQRVFGFREVRSEDLSAFVKWTAMLRRQAHEAARDPCAAAMGRACAGWQTLMAQAATMAPRARIAAVNRFMNEAPYVTDPRNYGLSDYWATPGQFLARDGDCEDYAIAKYVSLKSLGVAPERMRIVVLQDLNLDVAHAVLVVFLDDEILVLDNQIADVVSDRRIYHYRPIYSINESGWWMHRG